MQVLDRTGVGTLWSICKTKFALTGHTHTLSQITNAGAAAGKNIRTLGSVSHSSWENKDRDDLYVPTMSFIAYWNGAYSSNGSSNLQYCYKGKFGNLAVKDTADWSQITNKPDLKNWSETKSYIDSKAASLGGVEQILDTTEVILQDQFTDNGYGYRYTVGKFNSYKYIEKSTDGEKYHVVNIDYNFVLVGSKQDWPIEPDLPSFIISDNVEQVGRYKPKLDKDSWITKLYKIKDFNKTIYLDRSTYLYYKITEDGMKQCDSNGNILV